MKRSIQNRSASVSNIEICAALTLRHSKSAFNRANPIQRVTQGFEIYRYHSYGSIVMEPLSGEEYEALRQGEQLIETSMRLERMEWDTMFWVLRENLFYRSFKEHCMMRKCLLLSWLLSNKITSNNGQTAW